MAETKKSRQAKKAPDPMLARREHQLKEVNEILPNLNDHVEQKLRERVRQHGVLESVTKGLYHEVEKLSRKAPTDSVSDLVVERVNEVIEDLRSLMANDPYVQRQTLLLPGGGNPANRDVLIILRMILQGLKRCEAEIRMRKDRGEELVREAQTIRAALKLYVESGRRHIYSDRIEEIAGRDGLSREWLTKSGGAFDFERLDAMEMRVYFRSRTT